MVGFGVWGEYFSKLLERDFEKGGCGNVVSKLIVAVVSHNGRDRNGRDTIQDCGSLQMPRFKMSRQVSAAAALHSSAGCILEAINHNQDKLQTKIKTSWLLKRVSACAGNYYNPCLYSFKQTHLSSLGQSFYSYASVRKVQRSLRTSSIPFPSHTTHLHEFRVFFVAKAQANYMKLNYLMNEPWDQYPRLKFLQVRSYELPNS